MYVYLRLLLFTARPRGLIRRARVEPGRRQAHLFRAPRPPAHTHPPVLAMALAALPHHLECDLALEGHGAVALALAAMDGGHAHWAVRAGPARGSLAPVLVEAGAQMPRAGDAYVPVVVLLFIRTLALQYVDVGMADQGSKCLAAHGLDGYYNLDGTALAYLVQTAEKRCVHALYKF